MKFTIFFDIALLILTVIGVTMLHLPIILWTRMLWIKVSEINLSKKNKKIKHAGLIVVAILNELLIIPMIITILSFIYPFFRDAYPTNWILWIIIVIPLLLNIGLLINYSSEYVVRVDATTQYSELTNMFEEYKETKVNLQKHIVKPIKTAEDKVLMDILVKNINDIAVMYNVDRDRICSSILPMELDYIKVVNNKIYTK